MAQIKTKILYNKKVQASYFRLSFGSSKMANQALPGQFVNIKVSDGYEPLLRRPFGIHSINGQNIEILYEVLGQGTKALSHKRRGEYLDIIGPLGKGFDYRPPGHQATRSPILVAGGMGVAPLLFLAERITGHKVTKSQGHQVCVLIGAKTKRQILCKKEFEDLGCEVRICTDDGSAGFKGKVTELLRNELYAIRNTQYAIYACGPRPMLKEIAFISKQRNIGAQISLEEHMACGIGACLGCAVKLRTPHSAHRTDFEYKRVCKDGPVFNADKIIWG